MDACYKCEFEAMRKFRYLRQGLGDSANLKLITIN